jgi:hypothetical protein
MFLPIWALAVALTHDTGATESVQRSMRAQDSFLLSCFEERRSGSGSAELRFRVGKDGRATNAKVEALEPTVPGLSECLLRALDTVHFESAAVGADVVYPIRYQAATAEPASKASRTASQLAIVRRDAPAILDDWMVVDRHGTGVSDLDLAHLSGARELETELKSKRTNLLVLSLVEGLAGAGCLAGTGYAGYRLFQDTNPPRATYIGVMIGGAALAATAGALGLYHLIRAQDLVAPEPNWHHLEKAQAEELVGQANGE